MIYDVTDNYFPTAISKLLYDVCCQLDFINGCTYRSGKNEIPHYMLINRNATYVETSYDGYLMFSLHFMTNLVVNKYNVNIKPTIERFHIIEHIDSPKCFGIPHSDINPSRHKEYISCLYYPGEFWDDDWGGSTIISNNKVNFVPNRIVCFNSKTTHYGERVHNNKKRRFVFNAVFEVLDSKNPFTYDL